MAIEPSHDDWSMAPYSLEGQHAFVTGGGAGVGRATAMLFASAGANVVVTDINGDAAANVAREIAGAGGKALGFRCDVGSEEEVLDAFRRADDYCGTLDVLANVAAYRKKHLTMSMTTDQWDIMHAVIARGTFLCTREAVLRMRKSGRGGSIVNVSSASAVRPTILDSMDYDSAKAGVNAITRAAALEFAGDGIRVNAIMPGAVNRPGAPPLSDTPPTGPFTMPGRFPMNRISEPIEQARAILFLASPAASFISGVCLSVDGACMLS